jgi:hypothetical protein
MNLEIHLIIGINEESIRLAKLLHQQEETVYIWDSVVNGFYIRDDLIFIDRTFVDAIDYSLFTVYTYEHPYKNRQLFRVLHPPVKEKKSPDVDDETTEPLE